MMTHIIYVYLSLHLKCLSISWTTIKLHLLSSQTFCIYAASVNPSHLISGNITLSLHDNPVDIGNTHRFRGQSKNNITEN